MSDPLIPPLFILAGASFVLWGGAKLRATLNKPASEFRLDPRAEPSGRVGSFAVRVSEAFDSVSILFVGVVVFVFGLLDLLG